MKKIIILAFATFALYSCSTDSSNSSGFELKGNLSNSKGEAIYLEKLSQTGVTAIDNIEGNISSRVQKISNVDTANIGVYNVKYFVTDSEFSEGINLISE